MEELFRQLAERSQSTFTGFRESTGYWHFQAEPSSVMELLEALYRENDFWCDFLQSITAEHLPGNPSIIQLHYHLESLPRSLKVHVSCRQVIAESGELPVFPGASHLWKAAGWHEREAAELFGIHFNGHADLRRLLLPADWKGFPLRKDYQPADKYHGLSIRYDRQD